MRNAKGGGEGGWKGYVWGLLLLLARSEIWNMGQTRLGATVCKLICGQIFPRCQNYLCMLYKDWMQKFLLTGDPILYFFLNINRNKQVLFALCKTSIFRKMFKLKISTVTCEYT